MAAGLIDVRDFTSAGWAPGAAPDERARWYGERLEEGAILVLRSSPFAIDEADRAFLLGVRQTSASYHKNISYRPGEQRVRGVAGDGVDRERLGAILRDYSDRVIRFTSTLLAPYAGRWRVDFASFRPIEEQGRQLSMSARNDLLHVDAFPTRPTRGDRILRVFTNLHPTRAREWVTAEPFDTLAPRLARTAGLGDVLRPGRRALRAVRHVASRAGLPVPDRSAYDEFMLCFHHWLKANAAFQRDAQQFRWEFPPNTTWLVFTDMVPHAVASGQFALEQTFIVSRDTLLLPDRAPVSVLERLCGAPLVARAQRAL